MFKIFMWLGANIATIIGVLQAIVKLVKEIITGVVNIISLFMTKEQAEATVATLRGIINTVDEVLEWVKSKLI